MAHKINRFDILNSKVFRYIIFSFVVFVCLIFLYILYIFLQQFGDRNFSDKMEDWSNFGKFFWGLTSTILAFGNLFLLLYLTTRTEKIQKSLALINAQRNAIDKLTLELPYEFIGVPKKSEDAYVKCIEAEISIDLFKKCNENLFDFNETVRFDGFLVSLQSIEEVFLKLKEYDSLENIPENVRKKYTDCYKELRIQRSELLSKLNAYIYDSL